MTRNGATSPELLKRGDDALKPSDEVFRLTARDEQRLRDAELKARWARESQGSFSNGPLGYDDGNERGEFSDIYPTSRHDHGDRGNVIALPRSREENQQNGGAVLKAVS